MKITIRIEAKVPYTKALCVEELQIDLQDQEEKALYGSETDLAKAIAEMQARVNKAVAAWSQA
ncbi:MAG: hypothetical protein DME26_05060 [Verrucomicrobia bacterium]|nr:MAG: hypothetical protein DME26_05060 [Verrucomicrobiota bacterium]